MRLTRLACCFTLVLAACATAAQPDFELGTNEQVVATTRTRFPAEEGVLVNASLDDNRLSLVYSGGAPRYLPGDVVVGADAGGYLRHVLSADEHGDTVTLQTEPAAFGDAFETVRLRRSVHVVPDATTAEATPASFVHDIAAPDGMWRAHISHDGAAVPTRSAERGPAVLDWVFPNVSITLKDPSGNVRMTLAADALRVTKVIDLDVDIDYAWFKLQRLELIKDESTTITLTNVSIAVNGVLPLVDYSIPLYENPAIATIPVSVLVITLGVSVDIGVFAKLAASARVDTTSELKLTSQSREGFVYDGDYDVIWQRSLGGSAQIKSAQSTVTPVQLTAGAFIDASVNLRLYGVLGPEFYGRFYPIHADLSFGTSAVSGQLSAKARAGARFQLPLFELTLFDVPFIEYEHAYATFTKPY